MTRALTLKTHRKLAVPGGKIRQGALHACIATLRPGALHERWVSGRSGSLRPGCTTALFNVSELTYTDAILQEKVQGEMK